MLNNIVPATNTMIVCLTKSFTWAS
jgi:hypothetical protein